jgi:RNA polymerase sigma factor (sigma-70 family)
MTEQDLDPGPNDAELISSVRGGDVAAYGTLFARHVDAANRLAQQLMPGSDADDLVSESFVKVLNVLLDGGGPDIAFRAYLLTAVRRLHIDKIRATNRTRPTGDLTPLDPGVPFHDTAVSGFEDGAAGRAFASLPERWQLVLWHLEVEQQKPADVAPLLGMSANSVSALAYRAREGLREAFLNMHTSDLVDEDCRWTHDHLGGYVRSGLSKRDAAKVDDHLNGCAKCTAIYLELTEVNSELGALIAPLVLGVAAAGYLGTTAVTGTAAAGGTAAAATGGIALAFGRTKDFLGAHAQAAIAFGAAAAVAGAVAGGMLITQHNDEKFAGSDVDASLSTPTATATPDPGDLDPGTPDATPTTKTGTPTDAATADPTDPTTLPPLLIGTATTVPIVGPTATPSPTHKPAHSPSTHPATGHPATTPTNHPTTTPSDPTSAPPPPPTADVAVGASASGMLLSARVSSTVTGVPDGKTVTMHVRASSGSFSAASSSACQRAGSGYDCTVGPNTGTIRFTMVNLLAKSTISFDVTSANGYDDPNNGNNSTSVTVKGLG